MPGFVTTNMTKDILSKNRNRLVYATVEPDAYAKALLATVDKESVTYGCWRHFVHVSLKRTTRKLLLMNSGIRNSGRKKKPFCLNS